MRSPLFHQTMTALAQSLHCRLIASDLDFEHGCFAEDAPDAEVLGYALQHQYSRVALVTAADKNPPKVTHVALIDLKAEELKERRVIKASDLIAASTPVSQAIGLLAQRPFYFVLDDSEVRQIITLSDLNRLPVRTYLHVLLDHLEGLLADCIEQAYPHDGWKSLLSKEAIEDIEELHRAKAAQDFDTRLVDCTMLSQKCTMVGKAVVLRTQLGLQSANATNKDSKQVLRLRNRLEHGMPPLDKNADDLRDHVRHGNQLIKRADVDWLNHTVSVLRKWIAALADDEETS